MEESSVTSPRSRHKPRHHNESGETPKNPDKSETKEQTEE